MSNLEGNPFLGCLRKHKGGVGMRSRGALIYGLTKSKGKVI